MSSKRFGTRLAWRHHPCAFVSVPSSLIIGLIAGVLAVVSVLFFDRVKVDDPVGAAPRRSGRRAGTLT